MEIKCWLIDWLIDSQCKQARQFGDDYYGIVHVQCMIKLLNAWLTPEEELG